MAKKQAANFQQISQHIPEIETVRSDIKIHCESEPLLHSLLTTVKLSEEEFENIFESPVSDANSKKSKRKTKKQSHPLKAAVAAHLKLLLFKAKLEDFQAEISTELFHQDELIKFQQAHPKLADANLNFSRKLAPDRAAEFLQTLNKSNKDLTRKAEEITQSHQDSIKRFSEDYASLLEEFSEALRQAGHAVSADRASSLLKDLGGFHYNNKATASTTENNSKVALKPVKRAKLDPRLAKVIGAIATELVPNKDADEATLNLLVDFAKKSQQLQEGLLETAHTTLSNVENAAQSQLEQRHQFDHSKKKLPEKLPTHLAEEGNALTLSKQAAAPGSQGA